MADKSPAERILAAAVRAIPRGQVAGYGEVAHRAGLPGRARLAAKTLSENTDPKLPWHGVLHAPTTGASPCRKVRRATANNASGCARGVVVVNGRVRGLKAARTVDEQVWGALE